MCMSLLRSWCGIAQHTVNNNVTSHLWRSPLPLKLPRNITTPEDSLSQQNVSFAAFTTVLPDISHFHQYSASHMATEFELPAEKRVRLHVNLILLFPYYQTVRKPVLPSFIRSTTVQIYKQRRTKILTTYTKWNGLKPNSVYVNGRPTYYITFNYLCTTYN